MASHRSEIMSNLLKDDVCKPQNGIYSVYSAIFSLAKCAQSLPEFAVACKKVLGTLRQRIEQHLLLMVYSYLNSPQRVVIFFTNNPEYAGFLSYQYQWSETRLLSKEVLGSIPGSGKVLLGFSIRKISIAVWICDGNWLGPYGGEMWVYYQVHLCLAFMVLQA